MSTIVNHVGEGGHDKHAHLMPIYQTSTFGFDTVEEAGEVFAGKKKAYAYTRTNNPNMDHLANKIAYMEGINLIRSNPDAKMIFLETPSNPNIEIVDLSHLVEAAHAHDIWVVVDNTFATPYRYVAY